MFPHELSKKMMSLVAGEDRAAKTVILEYDDKGDVSDYQVCHSVIHVAQRMNYAEVQKILNALDAGQPPAPGVPQNVLDLLKDLDALAGKLRRRRQESGSIDLETPDYDVDIDERGHVVAVTADRARPLHGRVEEFMLSANRAVADFMVGRSCPHSIASTSRPGGGPERVRRVRQGYPGQGGRRADRKALQALLADVNGTHLSDAVNMQLLRSMQRAVYSPAVKPHYALNFPRYLHFTSPVRRYPDLLVHQVLDKHRSTTCRPGN